MARKLDDVVSIVQVRQFRRVSSRDVWYVLADESNGGGINRYGRGFPNLGTGCPPSRKAHPPRFLNPQCYIDLCMVSEAAGQKLR